MTGRVANPIPVGELLARELEARDWMQGDFAAVIQRPVQFVSEIVNGKKEITRESAAQIGAALGQAPEFWLNLQDSYLLSQQTRNHETVRELDDVRRRARLNELAPVGALMKRKILIGRDLDELERELMDLFELNSIEEQPRFVLAARRSNDDDPYTPTQMAWVACVRRAARERTPIPTYSREGLENLARTLPRRLNSAEEFKELPALLAEVGVCLVYVEALPGAKMDGCAFFLGDMPVIGLSGRGRRLDKVLFTLMHEIAHLALGHVAGDDILIESLDEADPDDSNEQAANRAAGSWVLPDGVPVLPERVSKGWITERAAGLGIHPIVLIGRLQNAQRLPWRTTLVKDAPTVTEHLAEW